MCPALNALRTPRIGSASVSASTNMSFAHLSRHEGPVAVVAPDEHLLLRVVGAQEAGVAGPQPLGRGNNMTRSKWIFFLLYTD